MYHNVGFEPGVAAFIAMVEWNRGLFSIDCIYQCMGHQITPSNRIPRYFDNEYQNIGVRTNNNCLLLCTTWTLVLTARARLFHSIA